MGLLSLAIWTPILFGVMLLALGRDDQAQAVRWIALVGALISLLVTLPLYAQFNGATAVMQFGEMAPWIERFNINYHLGIDGISLWFVLLTAFINLVVVIAGWEVITSRVNQYMGAFLILSGLMIGVFCALDGLLFFVFFEATLIPMYLIIGVWGGPNKIYAAFKFFLYTLLGSLLMLVALIYLYTASGGSFELSVWHKLPLDRTAQTLLFFAFLGSFCRQGPDVAGTYLAARCARGGTNGWLCCAWRRLCLSWAHTASFGSPFQLLRMLRMSGLDLMIGLSLTAVIYVGLVSMVQKDMKKARGLFVRCSHGFCHVGVFYIQ
jgi:NADH-quinone oxidoreductase subunit M